MSLLDFVCFVIEIFMYYIFDIVLDKCGIKWCSMLNFIVYSNRIVEKKVFFGSIFIWVGEDEFDILFCCYYLNNGIIFVVGIKLEVK